MKNDDQMMHPDMNNFEFFEFFQSPFACSKYDLENELVTFVVLNICIVMLN